MPPARPASRSRSGAAPRRGRAGLILAATALLAALIALSQCTFTGRALTYATIDPVQDVDWYEPTEAVPGGAGFPLAEAPPERRLSGEALAVVREELERWEACAVVVLHRGELVAEEYGCRQDATTRTNSMSLAKTVAALLVGAALHEGAIDDLDSPAARWIPAWAEDERREITLRHLLQMRSGLRYGHQPLHPTAGLIGAHLGTDIEAVMDDLPVVEPVGSVFRYNNLNTQALSLVVERATGHRWSEYLSETLWAPIGASEAQLWLDEAGGTPHTYCCLLATARDWARVGQLLLDGGKVGEREVVPGSWVQQMLRPSQLEPDYGFQIWRDGCSSRAHQPPGSSCLPAGSFRMVGRGGQQVQILPSAGLVIVRLGHAHRPWDAGRLARRLVELLGSEKAWGAPEEQASPAAL